MTAEDIPALIAEAQYEVPLLRRGTPLGDLIALLVSALEEEHQRAGSFRRQAEHFAMRGNLAEAERDSLRAAIRDALKHDKEWDLPPSAVNILSRAIDTKEGM